MLRRGEDGAIEAAMVLQADRLMGGAALLLAVAAPDRMAGRNPTGKCYRLVALMRASGSTLWPALLRHPHLPLAALDP